MPEEAAWLAYSASNGLPEPRVHQGPRELGWVLGLGLPPGILDGGGGGRDRTRGSRPCLLYTSDAADDWLVV